MIMQITGRLRLVVVIHLRVVNIDELVDQFAFGIKKHPLSVKNFLRYARATFAILPNMYFLLVMV